MGGSALERIAFADEASEQAWPGYAPDARGEGYQAWNARGDRTSGRAEVEEPIDMVSRLYRMIAYQAPGDGPDDGWDVVFPDFPGCFTQGDTPEEAVENAKEALALHIDGMIAEELELPTSSRVNEKLPSWVRDIDMAPDSLTAFLSMEIPGGSLRINITMDKALIDRLDAAASKEGTTRSGYLAQAVREKLQRNREPV
jgi:predicted RNase H-like HicB family nuclease